MYVQNNKCGFLINYSITLKEECISLNLDQV